MISPYARIAHHNTNDEIVEFETADGQFVGSEDEEDFLYTPESDSWERVAAEDYQTDRGPVQVYRIR